MWNAKFLLGVGSVLHLAHHASAFVASDRQSRCAQMPTPPTPPQALSMTNDDDDVSSVKKKRVVVIGGGWAGFSAADALATAPADSVEIVVLDASPRGAGGLAGSWTTKGGRPVEAGVHGFWREYRNTFAAIERIGLDLDDVLGPYSPSVLVSKSGRVALAPVLAAGDDAEGSGSSRQMMNLFSSPLESLAELLPPPLDVALVSEFNPSSPLTVVDRVSAVGLLGAWADFGQEDKASWDIYNKVSAEELFLKKAGVTKGLYDELVQPLLHVLPMCPGYDCSAAAALSCFHVFALQSKGAFDVRWCRGGITEKIFDPWAKKLLERGTVDIRGSSRVSSVTQLSDKGADKNGFEVVVNDGQDKIQCDGVIFAVGGVSMGKIVAASTETGELMGSQGFERSRGVTCVAIRLFLRPDTTTKGLLGGKHGSTQLPRDMARAMKDTPVVVCGPDIGSIPELKEVGFCIYDLQRMQDQFAIDHAPSDPNVAVVEVDFFRADSIASMSDDDEVAALTLKAIAKALGTKEIDPSQVVDKSVVRARDAVSHFAPNAPFPDVRIKEGISMAGDWIDRRGHASWSTEKSVVTGRQAAASIAKDLGLDCKAGTIPAAPDTTELSVLRSVASKLRAAVPPPGSGIPPSPWAYAREVLDGSR
mmetsp:Transcript_5816/g.16387  ORF Transcript_5816/g.16387 Transcript_5816/m.16387 type:complete len:647 (-) Transcript_5816:23-1963(-)